jgi:iron complex outermembrane receptor protein
LQLCCDDFGGLYFGIHRVKTHKKVIEMRKYSTCKTQFVVKPLVLAVAALSTVGGQAALAEEKQYAMEEVIVSATRRNESVQDVPISIDVLGEGELENNGVGDLEDFAHLIA